MRALATMTLGAAAASCAVFAAPAAASTIVVTPGHSIQHAVKRANPGDTILVTPGTYRGSVHINKNNLTLRGAGPLKTGTVLEPRHGAKKCQGGGSGICIAVTGNHKIHGTRVSGFLMRGFRDTGAIAFGAKNTVFRNNAFVHNGEYGAAAFGSSGTKFLSNRASDAGVAGFYVGDSPNANARLSHNVAEGNGEFGFFLRDSSNGLAKHNRVRRNCLGIGLINTGSPGGVHHWKIKHNRVRKNNRSCKAEGGGPTVSGTGIALLGASGDLIKRNLVSFNQPSKPGAFAPGGIVVVSSKPLGGGSSSNNRVVRNRALHDKPADIVWDGKGKKNRFVNNHCGKSKPNGLCH
jgi:parallel beta-helix repeat protein